MTRGLLTVVTATLGDSWEHLARQMEELRKFTSLPFNQIVSDDGTIDGAARRHQRDVVLSFPNTVWTMNPGPTYGLSYNLNHLLELVETPWAFVIEDAVRPSWGWLETAVDALEKVGLRKWGGRKVGALGLTSSFDHWELAVGGVLPGFLDPMEYFGRNSHETRRAFWSHSWNDGLLCWPRILPFVKMACMADESNEWDEIVRRTWRDPILNGKFFEPSIDTDWRARIAHDRWPMTRGAWPTTVSAAWGLVNVDAWKKVGRYRDGAMFYEGHLGVRMAKHGYLNVNIRNPPWLHYPSMAFHSAGSMEGREPRHHEPDKGPDSVFLRDFGVQIHEEGPSLTDYIWSQYEEGEIERIAQEMASIDLYASPLWKPWM